MVIQKNHINKKRKNLDEKLKSIGNNVEKLTSKK
jgi:hypothetical protein